MSSPLPPLKAKPASQQVFRQNLLPFFLQVPSIFLHPFKSFLHPFLHFLVIFLLHVSTSLHWFLTSSRPPQVAAGEEGGEGEGGGGDGDGGGGDGEGGGGEGDGSGGEGDGGGGEGDGGGSEGNGGAWQYPQLFWHTFSYIGSRQCINLSS